MSVEVLESIPSSEFLNLYKMLQNTRFLLTGEKNNRRNFPKHRRLLFGTVKKRYSGIVDLSADSLKYPHLFDEIERIGDAICPFHYKSVHVNYNVVCPPHKDENNSSNSCIVSFGEYTGCKLVVEGKEYDTLYTPVVFNGSQLEHWNTNDLVGVKYSLVYY